MLGVFIAGAVWVFAWQPARRRRARAETAKARHDAGGLRVGVDVGGTFTKAVALDPAAADAARSRRRADQPPRARRRGRGRGRGAAEAAGRAGRRARGSRARRVLDHEGDERAARGRWYVFVRLRIA